MAEVLAFHRHSAVKVQFNSPPTRPKTKHNILWQAARARAHSLDAAARRWSPQRSVLCAVTSAVSIEYASPPVIYGSRGEPCTPAPCTR